MTPAKVADTSMHRSKGETPGSCNRFKLSLGAAQKVSRRSREPIDFAYMEGCRGWGLFALSTTMNRESRWQVLSGQAMPHA